MDREVGAYYSKFDDKTSLQNFINYAKIASFDGEEILFVLCCCQNGHSPTPDWVFLGGEAESKEFFFMYERVIVDLHITIPFDAFAMVVLWVLNVAPTQLHPNGWASLQAFKILCLKHGIIPTTGLFLYYFCTRPQYPVHWVSLIRRPKHTLMKPFTSSARTIFMIILGNLFFHFIGPGIPGSLMFTLGPFSLMKSGYIWISWKNSPDRFPFCLSCLFTYALILVLNLKVYVSVLFFFFFFFGIQHEFSST